MENVFMTTTERKRMSTKTTFKRIALVAVAALGLGVLSVTPSKAVTDETLTLSATSASVKVYETASVTVSLSFTAESNGETRTVAMVASADAGGTQALVPLTTDSANVTNHQVGFARTATAGDSITATNIGAFTQAKWTLYFQAPTTAGTYTYTISSRNGAGDAAATNTGTLGKSATFTLTVVANDTTGVASKSLVFMNDTTTVGKNATRGDSTLVVTAGNASSPVLVSQIWSEPRNAADTTTSITGGSPDVAASILVSISGPGLLKKSAANGTLDTSYSKAVTIARGETANVYSDGTPGVSTITSSIGGINLTQAAKTLTFVGKPATITAKVESTVVTSSGAAAGAISFTVKDSATNAVTTNSVMNTGTPGSFYAVWADTKVATGTTVPGTGVTAQYAVATYNSTASRWEVSLTMRDSGTVSVVIADSLTAATAVVSSSAVVLTSSGAAYKGTLVTDKASYTAGEKAIVTVNSSDFGGRPAVDGTSTPFTNLKWDNLSATFGSGSTNGGVGSATTDLIAALNAGGSFVGGVDTYVVYMPTVAGTYVLKGMTSGETVTASAVLTFTVVDPTKDAADAATDAALEATDAAYAAQDAAQLAAESADAATAAAEAATAAAEAATAAVEDLATKVAGLFADLQKQITTLANVVAKIAKKVKA